MHIPFARWEDFDACVAEQKETGHDEESANKICGAIQARAEKGMLFKAEPYQLDIISKGDDLVVGGYSTWELRDPQNDVITTKAQVSFLQRLFKLPSDYQNVTVKHGDFKIGSPLLKYIDKEGKEYFSHVNEKGTYLLTKVRNDNFKSTALWRAKILKGELAMYSISGLPIEYEIIVEKGEAVRYIYDIEPWAPTLCEQGINPKAHAEVISKSPQCNTDICHGACCTFITEWEPRKTEDIKKYMQLHGVEVKETLNGFWLKYPIPCQAFDKETHMCKAYNNRPEICQKYPQHESPFIRKEDCSLLQRQMLLGAIKKQDEGEKPPKDWWDACVASVEGADPAAVCGHIFFHVLGGDRSRADPSMFEKGYVWSIRKIEPVQKSVNLDIEEIFVKHGFGKTKKEE